MPGTIDTAAHLGMTQNCDYFHILFRLIEFIITNLQYNDIGQRWKLGCTKGIQKLLQTFIWLLLLSMRASICMAFFKRSRFQLKVE